MTTFALEHDQFIDRLEELRDDHDTDYLPEYIHEDGSHTFILNDRDGEHADPRQDWCVAHLVMQHDGYRHMDDADHGIEEARERWGAKSPMVERYVRMFRPDIAHYEPRWEVTGHSQSDWAYGYGYVTRDDLAEAGYSMNPDRPLSGTLKMRAKAMLDDEVRVYGLYFAGEVYGAIHVSPGEDTFSLSDHGAYVDGRTVVEDACWGFLAYDDMKDIALQFTDSPITETRTN